MVTPYWVASPVRLDLSYPRRGDFDVYLLAIMA